MSSIHDNQCGREHGLFSANTLRQRRAGTPALQRNRGVTLVELTLALTIVAILAVAVTMLLTGASNTNRYINAQTQAMAEVETAYRRILHNVRTASSLVAPTTLTPGTTLTTQTQPDPSNSNNPWTVTYSLLNGNLVEDDPRYNGTGSTPNVLVTNVASFSVTKTSSSTPTTLTVTIISNTSPPVTRSATIECRNF